MHFITVLSLQVIVERPLERVEYFTPILRSLFQQLGVANNLYRQ